MFSSTITQTSYKVKEYIYLVLKKKPFIQQIFDDVKEEADKRFNLLIQTKINLLQGVKPDNPQTFLECFLLRGLIKILDQMFLERNIKLSEKDKLELEKDFGNYSDIKKKEDKKNLGEKPHQGFNTNNTSQ